MYQFVDGKSYVGSGSEFIPVINPATNVQFAETQQATAADVEAAFQSSASGFKVWSSMTAKARSTILLKAAAELRARNQELAELEVSDCGKPISEANVVDILSGLDCIEYYAGLITAYQGEQQSLNADQFFYTRREPLGVCAGIGAWNYPIQIAMWKSAVCLAAGNAMIFKPSEETTLSTMKLAEIYAHAGVPPGVFNVVQGDGRVGAMLSTHPHIAKVSFTGSCDVGRRVMAAAAGSLKSATMELGGKSPLIIFPDTDVETAVSAAMLANFYTQGEVCTNGTRVYVHKAIMEPFLKRLKERTELMRVGDPMKPETQVGALICVKHLQKVLGYIEQAKAEGATLVCGGYRVMTDECKDGNFVAPTAFLCTDEHTIVKEEVFGPVMAVLSFENEEDVLARANGTKFGLAAGVFTKDVTVAHRVCHQLQAGICWVNTWGNSPSEMPVGGYKHSGLGRENGPEALRAYTQTKSIFVSLAPLGDPFPSAV